MHGRITSVFDPTKTMAATKHHFRRGGVVRGNGVLTSGREAAITPPMHCVAVLKFTVINSRSF